MLRFTSGREEITFDKSITLRTVDEIERTSEVKFIVDDSLTGQIIIYTNDFFIICKHNYGRRTPLVIYDKYVFFALPDNSNYLLSYYMLNDIPIYQGNKRVKKIDLFGFSLINTIDKDRTPTIGN